MLGYFPSEAWLAGAKCVERAVNTFNMDGHPVARDGLGGQ